jgi:hypothetical protein
MRILHGMLSLPCAFLLLTLSGNPACAISDCVNAGVTFSDGAVSCQSGQQFRCSYGDWKALDLPCVDTPAGPALESPTPCRCSEEQAKACDQTGQGCCVSVVAGTCIRSCCPK